MVDCVKTVHPPLASQLFAALNCYVLLIQKRIDDLKWLLLDLQQIVNILDNSRPTHSAVVSSFLLLPLLFHVCLVFL